MRILRAESLGMCFGVRDAVALAFAEAESYPLTILGDLVHNATVLAALEQKGIAVAREPAEVNTPRMMVSAHGISRRRLLEIKQLGLNVVDATCPLVHVAHRAVALLVREGYHPVIIGQRNHVEVRGMTEDLTRFDVVLNEADVAALDVHPRIGVASQTTQPAARVQHLLALIRQRFPDTEIRFVDTVCKPTKQRQAAAVDLASRCDLVIVIGGSGSNNTRELVNTCQQYCSRVHHVENESDIHPEWFDAVETVGITAGTSTPDEVIARVERRIGVLAGSGSSRSEMSAL